ncbi:MAG: hypothetical protein H6Q90_5999 [Deltaproteobacteria bacterium]|nr:hypothetical protein [Deltaproteobacteria bacterium]
MLVLATLLCLAIGLSLGMLGGGGAALALPVFVYVAGLPAADAVTVSLIVVGATSLVATMGHLRHGQVDARAVALVAGAGIPGTLLGAAFTSLVPPSVLLGAFAVLLLGAAAWMGFGKIPAPRPARRWPVIAVTGAGVGILTGFLGVGGGFLLVPVLTRLVGLETRRAIGTSLAVITINCVAGVLGHLGHASPPLAPTVSFTLAAGLGAVAGQLAGQRLRISHLHRGFAILLGSVGAAVAWRVVVAS